MSEERRQTVLRFSLGGTAGKAALLALLVPIFSYFAFRFAYRIEEEAADPYRGGRWFGELLYGNGGMNGAIAFALLALLSLWMAIVLFRRFFTGGRAAVLTERGLLLHPTYRRRVIPFSEIVSAVVARQGFLINTHHLFIKPANGRRIRLQQNEIEGGQKALEAFAAEIEARRTFEGIPTSDVRRGDA